MVVDACQPLQTTVQTNTPFAPVWTPSMTASQAVIPTTTATIVAPTPTSTTPAPTNQPIPTEVVEPATATPAGPAFQSVYSADQRERLVASARQYIALDEPAAIRVARSLGYIKNDGHPASVCGPLSAVTLRRAGFISQYTDLHDFWLLNPRPDQGRGVLERTFPVDQFEWFHTDDSIAKFDFKAYPLKVGDFLYLYAGPAGSFEHMLVVARLDELGRPYSVTNFQTEKGYKIDEVLLYDPDAPDRGQFGVWTDRRNYKLGLTGYGGFDVIRRKVPLIDPGPRETQLAAAIDAVIQQTGGEWRILLKELEGRVVYARTERIGLHPASVIKVPIAMLFFKSLEKRGLAVDETMLADGIGGRTYAQLLRASLVASEEAATSSLLDSIVQSHLDITRTLVEWGAPHTDVFGRHSTAWEIAGLFEGLYTGRFIQPAGRRIMLEHLKFYTPGDDLRLGVLHKFLPANYPVYNKRGTVTDPRLIVADAAVFTIPTTSGDRSYVADVFAYPGDQPLKYEQIEPAMTEIALRMWDYLKEQ